MRGFGRGNLNGWMGFRVADLFRWMRPDNHADRQGDTQTRRQTDRETDRDREREFEWMELPWRPMASEKLGNNSDSGLPISGFRVQ